MPTFLPVRKQKETTLHCKTTLYSEFNIILHTGSHIQGVQWPLMSLAFKTLNHRDGKRGQ